MAESRQSELLSKLVVNDLVLYPSANLEDKLKNKKSFLEHDDIIELISRNDISAVSRMEASGININNPIGNICSLGGVPPIVYCFIGVNACMKTRLRVLVALLSKNVNLNFELYHKDIKCYFLDFVINVIADQAIIDLLLKAGAIPLDKANIPFRLPISEVPYVEFVIKSVYGMNAKHDNRNQVIIDLLESKFDYTKYLAHHIISLAGIKEKIIIKMLSEQMMLVEKDERNASLVKNLSTAMEGKIINKFTIPTNADPVGILRSLRVLADQEVNYQLELEDLLSYIFQYKPSDAILSALKNSKIKFKNIVIVCKDEWVMSLENTFGKKIIKRFDSSSRPFANMCFDYRCSRLGSTP